MNWRQFTQIHTRRDFLRQCAGGVGMMALGALLASNGLTAASPNLNPLAAKQPPLPATAKNVIFMFMEGGPSQFELFDPKARLQKYDGRPLPLSLTKDLKLAFIKPTASVMASPFEFARYGQCGMELSNMLPHLGENADVICLVRPMQTDAFNHHPGHLLLFTGSIQFGRPTMGARVMYGLCSESQNLPGFVVLTSGKGTTSGGASNVASGFLPSHCQRTLFRNAGDPILYLSSPPGVNQEIQRSTIDAVRDLNQHNYSNTGDVEIASHTTSYELAFRMQMEAPGMLDFSNEPTSILEMYGVDREDEEERQFAVNCRLARRLVERGVRFLMMMDASWDDHTELKKKIPPRLMRIDQPTGALIKDRKQRGLLDETLVVWGGEFDRIPMVEIRKPEDASNAGRDHRPDAYSMWMAGGGLKGGQVVGKTDEFCLKVVEHPIRVHDLQATMLQCLGFDHSKLIYRHMGHDFRLTDVAGKVAGQLLA